MPTVNKPTPCHRPHNLRCLEIPNVATTKPIPPNDYALYHEGQRPHLFRNLSSYSLAVVPPPNEHRTASNRSTNMILLTRLDGT